MPTYPDLTPEIARRALCQAGFSYAAEALTIDAREERWVVSLPDGRIAWFPASPAGVRRLGVERRVLGVLAARCSFRAPGSSSCRIPVSTSAGWSGAGAIPGGFTAAAKPIAGWRQKIGRSIEQILAEQHTQIVETDAAGWLPQQVPWPEAGTWIRERLPPVVADHGPIRGSGKSSTATRECRSLRAIAPWSMAT
jgi:hypothetical protein